MPVIIRETPLTTTKRKMKFRTHTGEIVTGPRLEKAIAAVAAWYTDNAHAIRNCSDYASHVTEAEKDQHLADRLADVQRLLTDGPKTFGEWQRVNVELTGKCPAFLP